MQPDPINFSPVALERGSACIYRNSASEKARDWTVVRRLARQIDLDVIDVAPASSLGRVVALDDRMTGRFKVVSGVTIGRVVAATDMPTTAAKSQMHPG